MPKKRLDAVVVHEESAAATIRSAKNTLKFEPATLVILNIFENDSIIPGPAKTDYVR